MPQFLSDFSVGLEIGGPSTRFMSRRLVPLYGTLGRIDNVNFASETLWESGLVDHGPFSPEGRVIGTQYVMEGSSLAFSDSSYDLLVSSHSLEHMANPMGVLREWRRVVKDEGFLLVVLPHGEKTFDRRRPITSIEHLREDGLVGVSESDDSHFAEILELHDFSRDPGMSRDELTRQLARNAEVRVAHHHVFNISLVCEMLAESGWQPISAEARWPYDIVVLAQKCESAVPQPRYPIKSPFKTDRYAT